MSILTDDDHLSLGLSESAACDPTSWERWIDRVEALLGQDVDGDEHEDGFSLDGFHDDGLAGATPEQAVAQVRARIKA